MKKKIVSPITLTRLLISTLIMSGLLVQFAVAQEWTTDQYDTNGDGTTDLHVRHRDTDADGKDDEWHFDRDKDGVFEPDEPHKTGVTKVEPYASEFGWQRFMVEHDGKWQILSFRDMNGNGDTADSIEMIEHKSKSSVFVSDRDEPGNWDIYYMDLSDLSVSRLTNNSAIDNHPAISPDGRWIVWSSTRGNGVDFDIYIAKLGDLAHVEGTAKRLTFDAYPNGPQTHYPDRHPHWSPDGTMIVFDSKNRPLDHPIEIKSECSVPKIITPPKFFENLNSEILWGINAPAS